MLNALFGGPLIFGQGQSDSYVDKAARAIPGMKANKETDIGRATGQLFQRFLFGIPEAQRKYTVNDNLEYQQRKPMGRLMNLPVDYKETELKAGAAAEAFRPGAGFPSQQFNPNQDLPASAEQSIDTNPMQYQMALYEQGRGAAKTQAEMNQVRDLGLAIHKAHNPHLYSDFQTPMASDRTFNPQMSGIKTSMFPEGYPATREGFVKGGGVQMPYTMTDKDAQTQVIEGNKKQGLAQLAEATQMLEEQAFMQEFMKDLEKKKK
jgi:hypothetical protein